MAPGGPGGPRGGGPRGGGFFGPRGGFGGGRPGGGYFGWGGRPWEYQAIDLHIHQ